MPLSIIMGNAIGTIRQWILRHSGLLLTFGIFSIALLLRLYRLDAQSLWLDEGGTWAEVTGQTGKGWLALIGELVSPDAGYPLYHLLLKAWVSVAGDSEWALRFPSALAGALAVVVVVLAGAELREESGVRSQESEYGTTELPNYRTKNQEPRTTEPRNHGTENRNSTLAGHTLPGGVSPKNQPTIAYRSQPRHAQRALVNHQHALWVQGVVPARRKVPETRRNGFWRKTERTSEQELKTTEPNDNPVQESSGRDAPLGRLRGRRTEFIFGLFAAASPYALWHAQDAKAYSLLFLVIMSMIWLLLRAMRRGSRRDWLLVVGLALASLLVHRLALLVIAGVVLAIALGQPHLQRRWRIGALLLALACAVVGLAGTMRAAMVESVVAGRIGVLPLESLWLTFVRFSLDRWPGDIDGYLALPALFWLLPMLLLGLWGLALVVRDVRNRQPAAITVLCVLLTPLLLLAALLIVAPVYESRYAMVAFPGWLLVTGYPLLQSSRSNQNAHRWWPIARWLLFGALLLSSSLSLFQPKKGLFSGDPLKEQWREAVTAIARQAHPDDLLLIHPSYVAGMYAYYAPRVTPDPLPTPVTFPVFAEGDTCGRTTPAEIRACWQRRYEPFFNAQAAGKKRALLLIAPDHARTVDPPKTLAELIAETPAGQPLPTSADRYGWVGLRFQYPQKTWPCGGTGDALIGVAVMCQSFPEAYKGTVPQPHVVLDTIFGNQIRLRGFTIDLAGGRIRPGGTLPITLYWAAVAPPTNNYRMFLHLCRDCEMPPLANDDAPPLAGYPPAGQTSTWRVGDPLHDERTVFIPANMPPGRYTILIGVYSDDGSRNTRLAITGAPVTQHMSANRLVLGEIEIDGNP